MRNGLLYLIVVGAGGALAQGLATARSSSQPVRPVGVAVHLQPGKFTLHTDAGPARPVLLQEGCRLGAFQLARTI
jgi:hypothetical protein